MDYSGLSREELIALLQSRDAALHRAEVVSELKDHKNKRLQLRHDLATRFREEDTADEREVAEDLIQHVISIDRQRYTQVALLKAYRDNVIDPAAPGAIIRPSVRLGVIAQKGYPEHTQRMSFSLDDIAHKCIAHAYRRAGINSAKVTEQCESLLDADAGRIKAAIAISDVDHDRKLDYIITAESTHHDAFTDRDHELLADAIDEIAGWSRKFDAMETDFLTGLYNRNKFMNNYNALLRDAALHGRHLGVAFIDANDLKKVNGRYGHPSGDSYLHAIAQGIEKSLNRKGSDAAYRYGGDEFTVLLPDTTIEGVRNVVTRIRTNVEKEVRSQEKRTTAVYFPSPAICVGFGEYQNYVHTTPDSRVDFIKAVDDNLMAEKMNKPSYTPPA